MENDPNHSDANHNLGVLAVSVGKIDLAIPFFRKAIESNPDIEQYHKSLDDALRTLQHESVLLQNQPSQQEVQRLINHFDERRYAEALPLAEKMTKDFPKYGFGWIIFGAIFKMLDRVQEALEATEKAAELEPNNPQVYSNLGIILQAIGRLDEAETAYRRAIELKPDSAENYYNLGVLLQTLDRLHEAEISYRKSIELNVNYCDGYINLGVALQDMGRFSEAETAYRKAIELKPNHATTYNNLGTILQKLSRFSEAETAYRKAIELTPDYADAYYNLGNVLCGLGEFDTAIVSYQKAVSIMPQNSLFWIGFSNVLQAVRLTSYSEDFGYYLLSILEQPTIRPIDVSGVIVSALKYHPVILPILELVKVENVDKNIDYLTEQLSTVPLLLRIMELSPIADVDVEKMLTKMRKSMLKKASKGENGALGLSFYSALAMHCFVNEYVFKESETEKQEIDFLQEEVKKNLANGGTVSPILIAILGAYRPLNSFSWAEDLLKIEWDDTIKRVIEMQINNVREEQFLRSKILRLNSIEDKVSQLVRNQYEENPYPRWVNTALSDKPRKMRQVLESIHLDLNFDAQQFSNKSDILVAGCGTGQHALSTASRFLNSNVLAMDLSLRSLSYAIRKTKELGITNIEYMQGDILNLGQLEREFDIIESVGVLHHMDQPLAGWKALVNKLRVGGVMKIGLYSEIARQHIVKARRQIREKKYTSSPDDIRQYREEVFAMGNDSEVLKVIGISDFYSLSECRDLLFHVQEHRFTLLQIEDALNNLGLKFLGFELKQSWIRNEFAKRYPEKDSFVSLSLWHQFEVENPDIFMGMYEFWVQKV